MILDSLPDPFRYECDRSTSLGMLHTFQLKACQFYLQKSLAYLPRAADADDEAKAITLAGFWEIFSLHVCIHRLESIRTAIFIPAL